MNKSANDVTLWSDADPFDSHIGLWRQNAPGHTAEVAALSSSHSGPDAASRLVALAQFEVESTPPFHVVLRALYDLQDRDVASSTLGCFRWYHEETAIRDTNAAFFIGLNLLVLHAGYPDRLDAEGKSLLQEMFETLDIWFDHEVEHGIPYYPNKFLGDLVCSWLLKETLNKVPGERLLKAMREAGGYYRDEHWGWGEHLSDPYSAIMLNELSCLLLMGKKLPEDIRSLYLGLFQELLSIDDAFAGGPRVPTIRSYAFNHGIPNVPFRDQIHRSTSLNESVQNASQTPHLRMFSFGDYFCRSGWSKLAESVAVKLVGLRVPCFRGAVASAYCENGFRVGSLSRYPIMPHTEHPTWGLSWQTMPVAFSGNQADWGFLRWQTRERGIDRFHPARDKHHAYLHNALTNTVSPPLVGQTCSHQEQYHVTVLRQMPQLAGTWELLSDGWDIVDFAGEVLNESIVPRSWSRLDFRLGSGRELSLFHYPLEGGGAPNLSQFEDKLFWRVTLDSDALRLEARFASIWLLSSMNAASPVIQSVPDMKTHPLNQVRELHWSPLVKPVRFIFGVDGWQLSADVRCE